MREERADSFRTIYYTYAVCSYYSMCASSLRSHLTSSRRLASWMGNLMKIAGFTGIDVRREPRVLVFGVRECGHIHDCISGTGHSCDSEYNICNLMDRPSSRAHWNIDLLRRLRVCRQSLKAAWLDLLQLKSFRQFECTNKYIILICVHLRD